MEIIKQIQVINPEKLRELCCMHLSFTLDLYDDEFASLLCSKNGSKGKRNYFSRKIKDKSFNEIPLTQESISQVYQIIEFLGRDINVEHEGLFRKTGSLSRQQELKALLNAGATIDFNLGHYTIDDCASVMKNFLSELPEPLLTEAHFSAHCQIAEMMKDDMSPGHKERVFQRQLKSIQLLLLLLPHDNYCLLKYLLLLLSQVKIAQKKNRMTSYNLATVFAPQILCPRKMSAEQMKEHFPRMVKVVSFLIDNATLLFEPPAELVKDISLYLKDFQFHRSSDKMSTEGVKTAITFCERTDVNAPSVDYTKKALSELQCYIQHLPNSARKRKLMKKLHSENKTDDNEDTRRKHFRSRSVGEAIKRHLWKTSGRAKENFHKNYHHSSYDMLSTQSASASSEEVAPKAKSVEALNSEQPADTSGSRSGIVKNWLRASKKITKECQ